MLNKIKELIDNADAILITAGAGMGVDSGLPDFRGNEGFWKAYPIAKQLNLSFQQLANPVWFDTNPFMAWGFYGHRYNLYKKTIPHDGFKMLLNLVKEKNDNYFVFTSNVDGQFQKAGFDENKIVECHGTISYFQCSIKCNDNIWENKEIIELDMDKFESLNIPLCPNCGNVARPNILMFNDWNWNYFRTSEQEYRYNNWLKENKLKNILIIEIGAGTAISTIRVESQNIARHYDGKLIRINPRDCDVDSTYGYSIPLGGLEGLKSIL